MDDALAPERLVFRIGYCVGAGAAGVERRVVVDGAGRSALLDGATSGDAAAGAAASVEGASRTIVGLLRRDSPPALIFIIRLRPAAVSTARRC